MGNRFDYLQQAVDAIFEEIGLIVKISSVYETPAMGFEGGEFLNCVLWLQTTMTPTKVLKKALAIEKKLGRERKETNGYTSRSIDIDILFADALVQDHQNLVIPHPEFANRRFVIQPMAEINAQFLHPVSGKNMIRLFTKEVT